MQDRRLTGFLVAAGAVVVLAAVPFLAEAQSGNTPVTVGEGSILIGTDPKCAFSPAAGCWQVADGAASFSQAFVIETRDRKQWKKINVGPKGGAHPMKDDCTKKDSCQITATFSDGTVITLSQINRAKGVRLTSSRVLGDYTANATNTQLEFAGSGGITLVKATLTKTQRNQTQLVDLCQGVAQCQVSVDHEP